jgi:CII-binding regulator of phage lambda lysogenization HflD
VALKKFVESIEMSIIPAAIWGVCDYFQLSTTFAVFVFFLYGLFLFQSVLNQDFENYELLRDHMSLLETHLKNQKDEIEVLSENLQDLENRSRRIDDNIYRILNPRQGHLHD